MLGHRPLSSAPISALADEARTRAYVADGGLVYGGAAGTVQNVEQQQGHGVGSVYEIRSLSTPIAIRQYGDAYTFRYHPTGGIVYGGEAEYRFVQKTRKNDDEEAMLLLLAA